MVNHEISRILRYSIIVSEFLIFARHVMLIYLENYIYREKLTFNFFHFKTGLISTTFVKEELIPLTNQMK